MISVNQELLTLEHDFHYFLIYFFIRFMILVILIKNQPGYVSAVLASVLQLLVLLTVNLFGAKKNII